MRGADDQQWDEAVQATLESIDATLAGEPVDPEYAELAELSLLLAAARPQPDVGFTERLDRRVHERFPRASRRRSWRPVWLASATGAALAAALVAVVVLSSAGGPRASAPRALTATVESSKAPPAKSAVGSGSSSQGAPSAASAGAAIPVAPVLTSSNGRKIVQSAELSLATTPGRLESVAQQVFNVVGAVRGNVSHSTISSAGAGLGYAEFQLSVPSSALPQTMTELSRLSGANVVSRSDSSDDITGSVVSARRRLVDARALRASLLRQLAAATTTSQADSLRAQIRDAEASISSDLATVARLGREVAFSAIALSVSASPVPHPVHGGGFTLGRAAHDARRVLVVAAGVALITLAVALPLAVVAAILAWSLALYRRRQREHALDTA